MLLLTNQSISQPTTGTKYGQRGELQEGEQTRQLLTRHTVLLLTNQSISQPTTGTKYGQRGVLQEGEQARELLTRHTVLLLANQSISNKYASQDCNQLVNLHMRDKAKYRTAYSLQ